MNFINGNEIVLHGISVAQFNDVLLQGMEERIKEWVNIPAKEGVKYLTRQETADMLSISLPTLWDWTNKGLLTSYRLGNKVYYKSNEVDQSLKAINRD